MTDRAGSFSIPTVVFVSNCKTRIPCSRFFLRSFCFFRRDICFFPISNVKYGAENKWIRSRIGIGINPKRKILPKMIAPRKETLALASAISGADSSSTRNKATNKTIKIPMHKVFPSLLFCIQKGPFENGPKCLRFISCLCRTEYLPLSVHGSVCSSAQERSAKRCTAACCTRSSGY